MVANAINELKQTHPNFHMDGASTNNLSWVGYENVLTPMNQLMLCFTKQLIR